MLIAIDFDGTLVEHCFPDIGPPIPHAFETLRALKAAGHKLILWTCREDCDGYTSLSDAVHFCRSEGVEFDAINEGITALWGVSRKPLYDILIDDRNFGGLPNWLDVAAAFGLEDKNV